MNLTPGVELIWSLAGLEAKAAKMKEVEPEHFFCALLKFSEMSNADLSEIKTTSMVLFSLISERDQIRNMLIKQEIDSKIRREIRSRMGQGDYQHPANEVLHRSEASRQVFEHAARIAQKGKGYLEGRALLQALLENPTTKIAKVLGKKPPRATSPEVSEKQEVLNRYVKSLKADIGAADLPDTCAPQIMAIIQALHSMPITPILLACDPKVNASQLVATALKKQSQFSLQSVDIKTMLKESEDQNKLAYRITELVEEIDSDKEMLLFLDVTSLKTEESMTLLGILSPILKKNHVALIIAIQEEAFIQANEQDTSIDDPFRIIWLHDLANIRKTTKI